MTQLSLFDIENTQYGTTVKLARETDPETSKQAAAKTIACGLNENQALFVGALRSSPIPLTAQEIAEKAIEIESLETIRQTMAKRDSVRKRAKELVDLGWVRVCESRECRVTGNSATTYEVVK